MLKKKKIDTVKNKNKSLKIETLTNKLKRNPVVVPKRTQEVIKMFFKGYDNQTNLFKITDDTYSMCIEYTDISFAKASNEMSENIFLKYVEYLNSFNEKTHIQVINNGIPKKTKQYKEDYIFKTDELKNENVKRVAKELNDIIEVAIGDKEEVLEDTRYIVLSTQAESYREAYNLLFEQYLKTEEKFNEINSKTRIVNNQERLEFIYNIMNVNIMEDKQYGNLDDYIKEKSLSIYDVLAPKSINAKEDDYLEIGNGEKYIMSLYVNEYGTSLSPIFYNKITTINDMNVLVTMNIQPQNTAKVIKRLRKKITGMKTERNAKKKSARRNNFDYEDIKDENLEERLEDTKKLLKAIQKQNQKIFGFNTIIVISSNSLEELYLRRDKILEIASENFISIKPIKWQQIEGLQHALPLGFNTIQFQRTLHSEAVAVNVPFNSKDIMNKDSLFYGTNLVSNNPIFADRRLLVNGNGAVLATSGAGKSFAIKLNIEQIYLRYPKDDIIIVDLQNEYTDIINAYEGQRIEISTTSTTHINPFDLDLNYDDKEPIKLKTEYVIAFIESIYGNGLTGQARSIIDRCTKKIYEPYEESHFQDTSLIPTFSNFYKELAKQPEKEAEQLCLIIERYINGSLDIFSYDTNVNIQNRLISFDISKLTESLRTTGYLVVLDYIQNRLARNKKQGKYTWIFIDEFHILLANPFSAEYVAKIYKTGRKLNAMNTIITQNIADVLSNEQGCKILSNSEFALLLKQKPLDLPPICSIFNISNEEASYISKASSGTGMVVFGDDKYPFRNRVPKDSYIYELNNTSQIQQAR